MSKKLEKVRKAHRYIIVILVYYEVYIFIVAEVSEYRSTCCTTDRYSLTLLICMLCGMVYVWWALARHTPQSSLSTFHERHHTDARTPGAQAFHCCRHANTWPWRWNSTSLHTSDAVTNNTSVFFFFFFLSLSKKPKNFFPSVLYCRVFPFRFAFLASITIRSLLWHTKLLLFDAGLSIPFFGLFQNTTSTSTSTGLCELQPNRKMANHKTKWKWRWRCAGSIRQRKGNQNQTKHTHTHTLRAVLCLKRYHEHNSVVVCTP